MKRAPRWHHEKKHAEKKLEEFKANFGDDPAAILAVVQSAALVALVGVQAGQLRELRKIRRIMEQGGGHTVDNKTVAFHLTGHLVPKQGGEPMPAGPFTPSPTEDVEVTIDPKNAAGEPTTGPFEWTSSNAMLAAPNPSADGKTCRFVVTPDTSAALDIDITCVDKASGNSVSDKIQRGVVDNATVNFNLSGSVVPKA